MIATSWFYGQLISAFVKIQQHYLHTMLIGYNNGQVVSI